MIFKDAMRSLRDDPVHTFFYLLTFFVTTLFMFVFFNMMECEMAVHEDFIFQNGMADVGTYVAKGDIANILCAYVITLCCVDILFANRFFIRNKAPEIAVRMICGATFSQLTRYLFLQITVMLLVALPLGVLCGIGLIPVLNKVLQNYLQAPFRVYITKMAVIEFIAVLGLILFWTIILNLSYIFQNQAAKFLNGQGEDTDKTNSTFGSVLKQIPGWFNGILGIFLFVYPLYAFVKIPDAAPFWGIVGILGMDLSLRYVVVPVMTKWLKGRMNNPVRSAVWGFLRDDLEKMQITLYLFIGNVVLLTGLLVTRNNNELAVLLILVTYIVMNVMQAMTIMFRLQTIFVTRNHEYSILSQVGFNRKQGNKVLRIETALFYGINVLIVLLYEGVLLQSLVSKGMLDAHSGNLLLGTMLVPLLVVWVISYFLYQRSAWEVEAN